MLKYCEYGYELMFKKMRERKNTGFVINFECLLCRFMNDFENKSLFTKRVYSLLNNHSVPRKCWQHKPHFKKYPNFQKCSHSSENARTRMNQWSASAEERPTGTASEDTQRSAESLLAVVHVNSLISLRSKILVRLQCEPINTYESLVQTIADILSEMFCSYSLKMELNLLFPVQNLLK